MATTPTNTAKATIKGRVATSSELQGASYKLQATRKGKTLDGVQSLPWERSSDREKGNSRDNRGGTTAPTENVGLERSEDIVVGASLETRTAEGGARGGQDKEGEAQGGSPPLTSLAA